MNSQELKPCPFCGDMPQIFTEHEGAVPESYRVQCYKLHHGHWFASKEQAIKEWNTRTTIPIAKVEELAGRLNNNFTYTDAVHELRKLIEEAKK